MEFIWGIIFIMAAYGCLRWSVELWNGNTATNPRYLSVFLAITTMTYFVDGVTKVLKVIM